jgi:predicted ATPase
VAVDDQTLDLIRQLCTRMGMIMEDEAETALVWDDKAQTTLPERLDQLNEAGASISRLAEAAMVLLLRDQA